MLFLQLFVARWPSTFLSSQCPPHNIYSIYILNEVAWVELYNFDVDTIQVPDLI